MDNKKDDLYYAEAAIEQIDIIRDYIGNMSYEEFVNDMKSVDAVMFRLVQMVENVKNISPEFKEKNPYIPWGKIIGFRNGIVHDYQKTDYSIVYEVAVENLLPLKNVLENIL